MSSNQNTKVSVVRGKEVNFTAEARWIQSRASYRQAIVVRLGQIVFFSSAGGDAWMLDPEDGYAVCLASPPARSQTECRRNCSIRWTR